jgi:hypothetical protein
VPNSSRYSGRHCIGLAIALAVLVGYFPSRAKAECGDYVVILNKKTASNPQEELKEHDRVKQASEHGRPHAPCRGPNCSGDPSQRNVPLAVPLRIDSDSKETTARFTSETTGADRGDWLPLSKVFGLPIHVPYPVFHPPRAV